MAEVPGKLRRLTISQTSGDYKSSARLYLDQQFLEKACCSATLNIVTQRNTLSLLDEVKELKSLRIWINPMEKLQQI